MRRVRFTRSSVLFSLRLLLGDHIRQPVGEQHLFRDGHHVALPALPDHLPLLDSCRRALLGDVPVEDRNRRTDLLQLPEVSRPADAARISRLADQIRLAAPTRSSSHRSPASSRPTFSSSRRARSTFGSSTSLTAFTPTSTGSTSAPSPPGSAPLRPTSRRSPTPSTRRTRTWSRTPTS